MARLGVNDHPEESLWRTSPYTWQQGQRNACIKPGTSKEVVVKEQRVESELGSRKRSAPSVKCRLPVTTVCMHVPRSSDFARFNAPPAC